LGKGKGQLEEGGTSQGVEGVNMTKVHYIPVSKCHNETHYCAQLIYANRNKKRIMCQKLRTNIATI
jgi:hypothetical protein